MRWLELSVEAGVEAVEAVSEILSRLGRGVAVRPTRLLTDPGDELAARDDPGAPYLITAHVPDDADAGAAIERTERALWHLQAFGLGPVGELHVTAVDESDWAGSWKSTYAPQRIGRVLIVPSWVNERPARGEVALRLDPGMAFGTGLHPSTRGCLELLQRLPPVPGTVLDVGSGSGILAIAALKLGWQRAVCLDTDPIAVRATSENAERNGLSRHIDARLGTLPLDPETAATPQPGHPLVLANLVAAVLVELAEALGAHTGPSGYVVASGIVTGRATEVVDALRTAGLEPVARLDDGDWVSLLLVQRGGRGSGVASVPPVA